MIKNTKATSKKTVSAKLPVTGHLLVCKGHLENSTAPNDTFYRTQIPTKRFTCLLASVILQFCFSAPVFADHIQQTSANPAAHQGAQQQHTATPKPTQEKPAELLAVEAALGKNMRGAYINYLSLTQSTPNRNFGFARYLHDKYQRRFIGGIVLAGVIAPTLATLTILGTVQIYQHALHDDGGFCNHVIYDEVLDEYDTDCKGDRGEVAGMITLSTIGGITTLCFLVPGIIRLVKYRKRLRRIEHLTGPTAATPLTHKFAWTAGPRQIGIGFQF